MTETLLDSLMPISVVMALGYLAGWTRDIDNNHLAELNALVMDFALPPSLFEAIASLAASDIDARRTINCVQRNAKRT